MDINNYLSYRNYLLYSNNLRKLGLKKVFVMWFKHHWAQLVVGVLALLGGISGFILIIATS